MPIMVIFYMTDDFKTFINFPGRKKTVKFLLSSILFSFLAFNAVSEISTGSLNVNDRNQALFTLRHDFAGSIPYSTLFIKDIESSGEPVPLTCYPEKMELMEKGCRIQIRNRYGRAEYDFHKRKLEWKERVDAIPENAVNLTPENISADGKYLTGIKRVSMFQGILYIKELSTGKETIIDPDAFVSMSRLPAKYSPDGSKLIYEKKGNLYYCIPEAMFTNMQLDEKYRKIGPGFIDCIEWNSKDSFTYIDRDLVYRIDSNELISLGVYSSFLHLGKIIGRLPNAFSAGDYFKTNRSGDEMILVHENCVITYMRCRKNTLSYNEIISSFTFSENDGTPLHFEIIWPEGKNPVIWAELISGATGKKSAAVYSFSKEEGFTRSLAVEAAEGIPAVSSDGKYAAFSSGSRVFVYSTSPWKRLSEIPGEKTSALLWIDNEKLCIGGESSIRLWNLRNRDAYLMAVSSAVKAWWNSSDNVCASDSAGASYMLDPVSLQWTPSVEMVPSFRIQNQHYRIFAGVPENLHYANAPFVRRLSGNMTTFPLIGSSVKATPARSKVILAFEALDDASCLPVILEACQKYNVKSTFFINGEFIRRYPVETRQISRAGYECASMFFVPVDLTGKEYDFNEEFIVRGLARVEDEFYSCTGKELALFWHAPFYKSNGTVLNAGKNAGYTYVDSDQVVSIPLGAVKESDMFSFSRKIGLVISYLADSGFDFSTASGR